MWYTCFIFPQQWKLQNSQWPWWFRSRGDGWSINHQPWTSERSSVNHRSKGNISRTSEPPTRSALPIYIYTYHFFSPWCPLLSPHVWCLNPTSFFAGAILPYPAGGLRVSDPTACQAWRWPKETHQNQLFYGNQMHLFKGIPKSPWLVQY